MHSHLKGHPALIQAIKRLEQLNPDQFEIYFEHSKSLRVDSKDQMIDSLSRAEDVGLSIRVLKDQRPGFSFTTSLDSQSILQAVDTAFEVASFMPEDAHHGLNSFGNFVYPSVDHVDTQGLRLSLEKKIELAKTLESLCRKADSRIQAVRSASITETHHHIHIVDSNGEHIEHESTGYTASVSCKAEELGDQQMGGEFAFSHYIDALPIDSVAQLAAQWAVELLGAKSAPTMRCPAILRNSVVSDLLDFLSASFSAEEIDKKRSMLADKKGEHLFSDQISIIHDGLLSGGMGTAPFDAEGTPMSKTLLVDQGFVREFLFDSYYAKRFGTEPNGCSVRGIKSPPRIGFANLYIQAGKKSFDSLMAGITQGILITDLMGIHTANPVTGDFSLGASGILIENGKLGHPVRGFAVAGNVLDLLRRVTDVGNDLKFYGKVGAPSLRLSEISVGGN